MEALAQKERVSIEEMVDKIRYWYDGFSWNGETFVYNPYSTMRVFDNLTFDNYWFETGTPTLLVKQVNSEFRFGFKDIALKKSIYEAHDLRPIPYLSLMLQTGYLTFKKALPNDFFKIDYPNKEVENAFSEMLLAGYLNQHAALTTMTILDIQNALTQHDIHRVMAIISDMFKLLPAQFFQEPREKTNKQGYKQLVYTDVGVPSTRDYHAIIFLIFKILGIQMHAEVSAQDGRIDAMVATDNYVYLFEFMEHPDKSGKKDRSPKAALNQIKKQAYEKLFALSKKQIYSIGVGFSAKAKGISNYAIEPEIA